VDSRLATNTLAASDTALLMLFPVIAHLL